MKSFLKRISLAFLVIFFSISQLYSHSVQVQYCISCNGDLRIWLEHWHGTQDPNSTTMTISVTINGVTNTITSVPGGGVINMLPNSLPGCSTPITYVTGCPGEENNYDDWVYYDFPGLPTNVPISFTIISGNTAFTMDGCGMYPLNVDCTIPYQSFNDQDICFGSATDDIIMDNNATWTNSNPSIGLPASGVGTIPSFVPSGSAGTTATISYNNLCSSGSFDFTVLSGLNISSILSDYEGYNVSCFGSNDGLIDLTVTGSTPGYTYLWDNGETTEDISNLTSGTYSVVITGGSSCATSASFVLNEPSPIQASFTSSTDYNGYDVRCYGYSDGGIDLTVSGSFPGYTYLWDNGEITEDLSNITAGVHSVIITDSNSCSTNASFTLNEPTKIQTSFFATDYNGFAISCNGYSDGGIDLIVSGSVPGYTYLWNNNETTEDIFNLESATYSVLIIDSNSCTTSASFTLNEPTSLQASIVLSTDYNSYNISCNGYSDGGAIITATGSVPNYTYLWSNGENGVAALNLSAGTQDVIVTDQNSCTTSVSFSLNEPSPLQASFISLTDYNGYAISCNGYSDGGIDLTVNGSVPGYTYLWDNGETIEDISNIAAGVHSVVISDINLCHTTASFNLNEPTPLQLSFMLEDYNGFAISCNGYNDGGIDLTVSGSVPGYTYFWNNNEITEDIFNLNAGMYKVDIFDLNGCHTIDSVFLNEPSTLISEYSVSNFNGYSVTCYQGQDGSIDLTVSGSIPPYLYQWSNGWITSDINSLSSGSYSYIVTDQNGCTSSDSMVLTEPILNISEVVSHVSCSGGIDGSISVNVNGSTEPYYVLWDNNINTSILEAGLYSYQIIDSIGCTYDHSISITEPFPYSVVEQLTNVSCFGFNDGSVDLSITGATPPYNIDWFGYNTFGMVAGTYNFTITDSNNCQYSEIVIVSEPNSIDVTFTTTNPSCLNSTNGMIDLSIAGGTPVYSTDWNGYNPNQLGVGTYNITVSDINGCVDTNSITLVALSDMFVIEESYDVTCEGFCDGSTDLSINNGVFPFQSNWFGYNPDSLCAGVFEFEIIDGLGCIYSDSVLIESPDSLSLTLNNNNGTLEASVVGGIAPFSYSWFNLTNQLGSGSTLNTTYMGDYYCIAYDSQHCKSDTSYYLNKPLVVDDLDLNNLLVYPNPTSGSLNINLYIYNNTSLEISLIDILGKRILIDSRNFFSGEYKKEVDLSSLKKGIYIIEMRTNRNYFSKTIILD